MMSDIPQDELDRLQTHVERLPAPIPLETTPLHQLLGPALLCQFMLMSMAQQDGVRIYCFKHVATRRALMVGDDLRCWNYDPAKDSYHHIPAWNALAWSLEGSDEAGLLPGMDGQAWQADEDAKALTAGRRVLRCVAGIGIVTDTGTPTGPS